MIKNINNTVETNKNIQYSNNKQMPFKGNGLSVGVKILDGFIKSQENLSSTRFIQDTVTNWCPKVVFSRSKADFAEFTFLEFLESGIFYFAAPFLGEHLYRNGLFKKLQNKNISEEINKNLVNSLDTIKKSNLDNVLKKKVINTKAGMLAACLAVPTAEYALSFAKNLFTLKVFKISDFNNVANLNKEQKENIEQQKRVEKNAKKELLKAGIVSLSGLGVGLALAKFGHKSNLVSKFSEFILEPGDKISQGLKKIGINSQKTEKFLKDYLKLDFDNNNGKLALSKGQLAAVCITGLFGYSNAAKDRGKLDFYEVWTRVPLVVIYTIFGSSLLDNAFKNILAKKGKFPELLKKTANGEINVPQSSELPKIAKKLAKQNNTTVKKELSELIKQKSIITGVPYAFALLIMGFSLSGITRLWTQIRYNQMKKKEKEDVAKNALNINPLNFAKVNLASFKAFENKFIN